MSYFIYLPTSNLASSFFNDDVHGFCPPPNNQSIYSAQSLFLPQNFNTTPLAFAEMPCVPSQLDFMIPTSHSLPQLQPEPVEEKEPKKR